jgi:hypothetical protein
VARDRAGGLVFVHRRHRGVAHEAANLSRAAWSPGKRRRRRTMRRGGGTTPATAPRRYGPRARRQAALASSSPSCATPERHLDGGVAATAKNGGDGELGFRRLGWGCSGAARVWIGVLGMAARLK